jgi:hypothetical protein
MIRAEHTPDGGVVGCEGEKWLEGWYTVRKEFKFKALSTYVTEESQ